MIKEMLKGRFLGHPVHLMLVHFPAALFPLSAILSLLSHLSGDIELARFSFYSAAVGAVIGWCALIFGVMDLLKIKDNDKALNKAITHGTLNFIWLIIFTITAGLKLKTYPILDVPDLWEAVIKLSAVAGMIYSNFLGGELLLKYRIGIIEEKEK